MWTIIKKQLKNQLLNICVISVYFYIFMLMLLYVHSHFLPSFLYSLHFYLN